MMIMNYGTVLRVSRICAQKHSAIGRQQLLRTTTSIATSSPRNLLVGQRATASLAPQVEPRYESDLVVVLDMDECLLHSRFLSHQASKLAYQVADVNKEWNNKRNVDSFHITLPDGDVVHVHPRPFLTDFLEQVTQRYETHIFTAAMSVYAKPVLDYLDPSDQLAGRWYRESCVFRDNAYVKDLNILNKPNLDRVVLVDNNPLSFLANPENGILVQSYYSDDSDKTLLAVLDLLRELEDEPDVKPLLERKFGLKTALHEANRQGDEAW